MPTFTRRSVHRRQKSRTPETLLESGLPHLVDERSDPDFRAVYGLLARRSSALDTAVASIRLTGVDLRPEELRSLNRVRVLLAEVNVLSLRAEAEAILLDPSKGPNLDNLVDMMDTGRIEVRSAPLAGWAPDFSVFHRKGRPWILLTGLHRFSRPFPHRGPALASLHGPGAAGRTAARFTELWTTAHDIGPAILGLLREARQRSGRLRSDSGEGMVRSRPGARVGRPEPSVRERGSPGPEEPQTS